MKSKVEIIQETANFYNSNNLGYCNVSCSYLTEDGKKCAVGRCMTEEGINKFGNVQGSAKVLAAIAIKHFTSQHPTVWDDQVYEDFDRILKEEYRGHEIGFWRALQHFHDTAINWVEKGLSTPGEYTKNGLLERYMPKS